MTSDLNALDELRNLSSLDEGGKPPRPSRLSSATAARELYTLAVREDQNSAVARVRIQGCKDGEAPFNAAALIAAGQGSRCNANFLMMEDRISRANKGLHDIVTSPKILMTTEMNGGEIAERADKLRIITTELTRTIRKWPGFIPTFMRLVDIFDTHGVSFAYFPDTEDFRFEAAGLGNFLLPRGTEASDERIPYAIARKDMSVTDLYDMISDEQVATDLGWNVQAVKNAIVKTVSTQVATGEVGDWEQLQQQIKSNDVFAARKFAHVAILWVWVKEFDGSISFFIVEKDNPNGDFLCKVPSRFESVGEAFVSFCYGVGSGTFHSIRGLGHMIFALCQLHNRLMCQKADAEMLSNSIMVQAASGNALQEASINYLGPISLIAPGLDVLERQFTGRTEGTLPFLAEVQGQVDAASSRFTPPSSSPGAKGTYQNKMQVESGLEEVSSGDSGSLDMFYASWDRVIREMCRRIINGPKSDKLVAEFHRRVAALGITPDDLKRIDHDSTYAYRAMGAGSPAARQLGFRRLLELLPQLDEIGRKRLIFQFVADIVGYQNAEFFASDAEEPRLNSEASLALLENILLMQGNPVPVLSYQMHASHVQMHLPSLLEVMDGVETGTVDPMEVLPGLQASLDHLATHGEALAADPTQAPLYGQVKEAVNNLQLIVNNMDRKIKAEQRKAAESGIGEDPGSEQSLAAEKIRQEQLKTALLEFKVQLAQQVGELKLAEQQAKSQQSLALGDLKAAASVQKEMRFPRA